MPRAEKAEDKPSLLPRELEEQEESSEELIRTCDCLVFSTDQFRQAAKLWCQIFKDHGDHAAELLHEAFPDSLAAG